jgi:hypothetical protein
MRKQPADGQWPSLPTKPPYQLTLPRLRQPNAKSARYPIPAEIDLGQYRLVIIRCEQISVLFSAAGFTPAP